MKQQSKKLYLQHKDELLLHVRYFYFAVGCKVVVGTNVLGVKAIIVSEMRSIWRPSGWPGDAVAAEIRAATQEGLARSSELSACDYWHDHPDEVHELRQMTARAAMP
jgi:hypothetical protein